MVRYRIYSKNGTSFLARKGETLKEIQSWKRAYNKHNKDKVASIVTVKDRKITKKPRVQRTNDDFGVGFDIMRF